MASPDSQIVLLWAALPRKDAGKSTQDLEVLFHKHEIGAASRPTNMLGRLKRQITRAPGISSKAVPLSRESEVGLMS